MLSQRDVIYWYDGSFEGFLCCVFNSFEQHEVPWDIWPYNTRQTALYPGEDIPTDQEKAQRVYKSIREKLGSYVHYLVMTGFLNGNEGKEIRLLRFLRLVYAQGPQAAAASGRKEVADVIDLGRQVSHEACHYKEFIRFEEREGMLGAVISPKHYVLPLLRSHFCDRFPEENFIIYDNCHYVALVWRDKTISYTNFEGGYLLNSPEQNEASYQRLWKKFYEAVSIKERENLKLRQQHCPKRFWDNMVELKELA